MSRIGKLPIELPADVTISVSKDKIVTVKGKLGELQQRIDDSVELKIEGNIVVVERASEAIEHRAKHGLYRSLINNMVKGVSTGFNVVQELVGVGYKADAKGDRKSVV